MVYPVMNDNYQLIIYQFMVSPKREGILNTSGFQPCLSINEPQLKYALENIETFIHTELHPDAIQLKKPAGQILSQYISQISLEKNLVRTVLKEAVFCCKKEKSIELLIKKYQSSLINLADELIQSLKCIETFHTGHVKNEVSILTVYHHTLKCLEDLLTFIEKHFSQYFNIHEKIPESYKLLMQADFRYLLTELLNRYNGTNIDPALINIMFGPFQKFINTGEAIQTTYKELHYLKTLHLEFSEIILPDQRHAAHKIIIDLLLYLNFNHHAFVNYYINIISKDLNEAGSIFNQIEQLAWWLKTISQVHTKPEVACMVKDPSAKEQLIDWMTNEMTFLERKQQLTLIMPPLQATTDKTPFIIHTSLIVKQAALLTRLLVDTEIIKTDNQTELLANLAAILKTENKENISPKNLRTRYYNIEASTINSLKDWLIKMLNQLHQYKAE